MITIATRANVAIYVIDSGGLSAGRAQSRSVAPTSPLANVAAITNQRQRIEAVGGESEFDLARQEGLNREQDILYQISGDTGGQFIKGTNDIGKGLARIDEEIHALHARLSQHKPELRWQLSQVETGRQPARPRGQRARRLL